MLPFIASALLPFRRANTPEPEETERRPNVAPLTLVPPLPPVVDPIKLLNGGPTPLARALQAMVDVLDDYTLPPIMQPPPPPPLPPANVLLASVVERTVGVGSRVGLDLRGPFSVAELKGLRVESLVRFELWAHTPAEVAQAAEDLVARLLGDREALRGSGFLRIALKGVNPSENVFSEDAWRQFVEFDTLFEFPYVDTSDAESLIAQIPIHINSEHNEDTIVVDEMARWDNETAPTLRVRGPIQVGALTALAFIPGAEPVGSVTITRTFDGASGPPASFPTLADFTTAVAGENPAERHAEVTFASLVEFLAAISTLLEPIVLGDWDLDGVPDEYKSSQFRIDPSIRLTTVNDRLEIAFEHPELSEVAVVYLRASTGSSSLA